MGAGLGAGQGNKPVTSYHPYHDVGSQTTDHPTLHVGSIAYIPLRRKILASRVGVGQ